jgi:hypothetical protein
MYSGLGARASRISRSPLWQYLQIAAARRLGTDALTEFDRHRYFELAVFPENAQIPVETICTLWRAPEAAIRPIVGRRLKADPFRSLQAR